MGLVFVPVTLIATSGVPHEDAGLASGMFNTSQQIGGALGLAILSTLAADKTADVLAGIGGQPSQIESASALVDGFHVAYIGSRHPSRRSRDPDAGHAAPQRRRRGERGRSGSGRGRRSAQPSV